MEKYIWEAKERACNDVRELMESKPNLDPEDYKPLGAAIDIIKDVMKIELMEQELMSKENGPEMWEDQSRMSGVPARSPRTGQFVSRAQGPNTMSNGRGRNQGGSYGEWEAYGSTYPYPQMNQRSYHDYDGSIRNDINELVNSNNLSDHERMLLMRVQSKLEEQS